MSEPSAEDILNWIVVGWREVSTAVTTIFDEFKRAMDSIMPKLNKEEQQQVIDAFGRYTSFLMKTQEFIGYTLIGVRYAETIEHLVKSVPTDILMKLIEEVQNLIKTFDELQVIVKRKIQDESSLGSFSKIMLGVGLLGTAVLLIGTGVGATIGFGLAAKTMMALGATAMTVGAAGTILACSATRITDFGQVIRNLQKMRECLLTISQEQNNMQGTHGGLANLSGHSAQMQKQIVSDMKTELTAILNKTQVEVNNGFDILKRI